MRAATPPPYSRIIVYILLSAKTARMLMVKRQRKKIISASKDIKKGRGNNITPVPRPRQKVASLVEREKNSI